MEGKLRKLFCPFYFRWISVLFTKTFDTEPIVSTSLFSDEVFISGDRIATGRRREEDTIWPKIEIKK